MASQPTKPTVSVITRVQDAIEREQPVASTAEDVKPEEEGAKKKEDETQEEEKERDEKTEEDKAEEDKAEEDKAEEDRAEEDRADEDRADEDDEECNEELNRTARDAKRWFLEIITPARLMDCPDDTTDEEWD